MNQSYNILFLCTGNSARSILAEAIVNADATARFRAWSAGSFPKGDVHPQALALLADRGFPTDGLRSKSWDEFAGSDGPAFDFIFTVCDQAAGETCPVWPGKPIQAHWGIEDPAAAPAEDQPRAFATAFAALKRRIDLFRALPLESIDALAIKHQADAIGRTRDA